MTDANDKWVDAASDVNLRRDEVHAWRMHLDVPRCRLPSLTRTLSIDERHRAGRFRFERDRARFIARHGLLRTILGRYVDLPAGRLRFRSNAFGKPALACGRGADDLTFNLSHSDGIGVLAVACNRALGIDTERMVSALASEEVASAFFSRSESQALRELPAALRAEAFFHCWTCKEAYVKAIGEGLSFPLARFVVSVDPGKPPRLIGNEISACETERWSFRALAVHDAYKAALVVEGHDWHLKCLQWPGQYRAEEAVQ